MAKTDFKDADEYIATFPEPVQDVLRTVRAAILDGVPEAEEAISYQIPATNYHGWIFYYSAHQKHFSLSCPPPTAIYEEFAEQLAAYSTTKSAIRFPLDQPVPVKLIADMARFRAEENLAKEAQKPPKAPRAPRAKKTQQ